MQVILPVNTKTCHKLFQILFFRSLLLRKLVDPVLHTHFPEHYRPKHLAPQKSVMTERLGRVPAKRVLAAHFEEENLSTYRRPT